MFIAGDEFEVLVEEEEEEEGEEDPLGSDGMIDIGDE